MKTVFVTSLPCMSYASAKRWQVTRDTIESIQSQKEDQIEIVICCCPIDAIRASEEYTKGVTILSYSSQYPPSRCPYERVRQDKGAKIAHAINFSLKKWRGIDFFVIFDSDDLFHPAFLVSLRSKKFKNGIALTQGYAWHEPTGEIRLIRNFDQKCGTCLFFKAQLIDWCIAETDYPADILGNNITQRLFGSHRFLKDFFELSECHEPLTVYRMEHGENHSSTIRPFSWSRLGGIRVKSPSFLLKYMNNT